LLFKLVAQILGFCLMQLFADDLVGEEIDEMVRLVNEDLERVAEWLEVNKLVLNVKKCKVMIITRLSTPPPRQSEVMLNGEKIEMVTEMKYLGVVIDDELSLKPYFNRTLNKLHASKTVRVPSYKYRLTKGTKKDIFMTLVKPHFNYCSSLWYRVPKELLNQAQKITNQAMRIILGCVWDTSVRHMTEELDWLMVEENVYLDVMMLIYKIDKDLTPTYLRLTPRLQDVHNLGTHITSLHGIRKVLQNQYFWRVYPSTIGFKIVKKC